MSLQEKRRLDEEFSLVQRAYAVLSDPAKRREYDASLAASEQDYGNRSAYSEKQGNHSGSEQDASRDNTDSCEEEVEENDPDWEPDYRHMREWVRYYHQPTLIGIVQRFGEFGIDRNKAREVLNRMIDEGYVERHGNLYVLIEEDYEPDDEDEEGSSGARSRQPFRPSMWRKAIYTVVFVAIWLSWRSCSTSPTQTTNSDLANSSSAPAQQTSPATDASLTSVVTTPPAQVVKAGNDRSSGSATTRNNDGTTLYRGEPAATSVDSEVELGTVSPTYPPRALRDGLEGTVLLEVTVDENGEVANVRIVRSSGYAELDRAAKEAIPARAAPAMRDGVRTTSTVQLPVTFKLEDK